MRFGLVFDNGLLSELLVSQLSTISSKLSFISKYIELSTYVVKMLWVAFSHFCHQCTKIWYICTRPKSCFGGVIEQSGYLVFEPNLFVFVFLTKYIRIHIRGSKYYSLTSFRQAGTLKTHMLSHSGMKPHKCGQCEKSFRVAANLKTHILTHTGVKKHSC